MHMDRNFDKCVSRTRRASSLLRVAQVYIYGDFLLLPLRESCDVNFCRSSSSQRQIVNDGLGFVQNMERRGPRRRLLLGRSHPISNPSHVNYGKATTVRLPRTSSVPVTTSVAPPISLNERVLVVAPSTSLDVPSNTAASRLRRMRSVVLETAFAKSSNAVAVESLSPEVNIIALPIAAMEPGKVTAPAAEAVCPLIFLASASDSFDQRVGMIATFAVADLPCSVTFA